jgi:hypothetical protein
VIDQHARVVLGQVAVNGKSNELIGRCAASGGRKLAVTGRVDAV